MFLKSENSGDQPPCEVFRDMRFCLHVFEEEPAHQEWEATHLLVSCRDDPDSERSPSKNRRLSGRSERSEGGFISGTGETTRREAGAIQPLSATILKLSDFCFPRKHPGGKDQGFRGCLDGGWSLEAIVGNLI